MGYIYKSVSITPIQGKNMKYLVLIILLCNGCAILRPEWHDSMVTCQHSMPFLDHMPTYPYRIIGLVKGKSEDDMAWQACGMGAHAIIRIDDGKAHRKLTGHAIVF